MSKVETGAAAAAPNLVDVLRARDELAAALQAQADADAEYNAALEAFEREHADLVARRRKAQERAKELEAKARAVSLDYMLRTGDEKPAPGFGIQRRTDVQYDPEQLFRAALTFAPFLLKLDEKRVLEFAQHNCREVVGQDGVKRRLLPDYFHLPELEIVTRPIATISKPTLLKEAIEVVAE